MLFSCQRQKKKSEISNAFHFSQLETEDEYVKAAKSKPLTTIALLEPNFDFGKIKKGSKVSHIFEIVNTGDKPLIISDVKPGCGCTIPEFTKEPVLSGQKAKITLNFDSTNFDGMVNKFANVYTNTEKTPVTLTFTADIQH
jgi:hypothetical protein